MDYARAMSISCPPPITWSCGDTYDSIVRFDGGMVPSDADLQAIFSAYVPLKSWAALDFLLLFTTAERVAMATAAETDHTLSDFRILIAAADRVYSNGPFLMQGMNYLVAQNLITQDRMNTILAS